MRLASYGFSKGAFLRALYGLPGLQVEDMWVLYEGSTWGFKGLIIGVYLKVWDVGLRVLDEGSMRSA